MSQVQSQVCLRAPIRAGLTNEIVVEDPSLNASSHHTTISDLYFTSGGAFVLSFVLSLFCPVTPLFCPFVLSRATNCPNTA